MKKARRGARHGLRRVFFGHLEIQGWSIVMKKKTTFQIVDVADEHLAVPVGSESQSFQGVAILSEPAAFLLRHMEQAKTRDELVALLVSAYEVDAETASADVDRFLLELADLGMIET